MYLKSKNIVFENHVDSGIIKIEDGIITNILDYNTQVGKCLDVEDAFVMPGIIDMHTHGYAGWSFTATSNKEDLQHLSMRYLTIGVTSLLATASPQCYSTIIDVIEEGTLGCEFLGLHSEGPFLNSKQHGAAPLGTRFPTPNIKHLQEIMNEAKGYLRVMTIAPEVDGAQDVIDVLNQLNVICAVGHTESSYDYLSEHASDYQLMTHLGNAMSGVHHRTMGALGFGLLSDISTEIICDGNHIKKPMLGLIFKSKSFDELILVSDTIPLAGCPKGTYTTPELELQILSDGSIVNNQGKISGSSRGVLYDMKYLHDYLNIELLALVRMASLNPARKLGMNNLGVIKEGYQADIIVIDKGFNVKLAIKKGQVKYHKDMSITMTNPKLEDLLTDKRFLSFYAEEN